MSGRSASAASLHKKVALLTPELDEAHQRQAATADARKVNMTISLAFLARSKQHHMLGIPTQ